VLSGWEWIIIGIIAVVVILWGPGKIPEFARALGRAKGEFDQATKEFNDAATKPIRSTVQNTAQSVPANNIPTSKNGDASDKSDDALVRIAKRLGITTEGKTRAQIAAEIRETIEVLGSED